MWGQCDQWLSKLPSCYRRACRWQQDFRQQAHIVEWLDTPDRVAQFMTAPMRWHGQVVGFVGTLHKQLPERTSIYTIAPFQFVVLRPETSSQLPNVGEQALVAGQVAGTTVVELPGAGARLLYPEAGGGPHGPRGASSKLG